MNETSSSGGIGFVGLLTILFIGLKLTDFISWSWWWVLSPLWISAILVIVFVVIFVASLARSEP
jgi:membrane protein YdbS with pleckstrin-like domain